MFGPRVCLLIGKKILLFECAFPYPDSSTGGWCYPLYSGALLCYNHTHNSAFVIASGAVLGIGASFLWVAQGAVSSLCTWQVYEVCLRRLLSRLWCPILCPTRKGERLRCSGCVFRCSGVVYENIDSRRLSSIWVVDWALSFPLV